MHAGQCSSLEFICDNLKGRTSKKTSVGRSPATASFDVNSYPVKSNIAANKLLVTIRIYDDV